MASLLQYAVDHLIPPSELITLSAGRPSREPFLFNPSALPPAGQEQDRLVLLLSHLYLCSPKKFDEAAPQVKGTKRTYFGKTKEEITATGSSNHAMKIPDSPWFVSVNNAAERKALIVERLMIQMGFSSEYSEMISTLSYRSKARLPWPYRSFMDQR